MSQYLTCLFLSYVPPSNRFSLLQPQYVLWCVCYRSPGHWSSTPVPVHLSDQDICKWPPLPFSVDCYGGWAYSKQPSNNQYVHHQIVKKSQQRLLIICKLRALYVAPHLLLLFYQSIIQPILFYWSTCFFTMLIISNNNKLLLELHILWKSSPSSHLISQT